MNEYIIKKDVLILIGCMPINPTAEEMDELYENVKMLDAADVRPVVRGRWNHEHLASTSGGTYEVIRCSECRCAHPMFETAYCPCCGADMRPEVEDHG